MLYILYVLVNVISFIVCLVTLEIVWANVKAYWHERNYLYCLGYLLAAAFVFFLVACVSDYSNTHFRS